MTSTEIITKDMIRSIEPTKRHAIIDRVTELIYEVTPTLPDNGICECGYDLHDEEDGAYSLDYSVGWQPVKYRDGFFDGYTIDTDRNTVTDLLCPNCERLYHLPEGQEINWV